MRQSHQTDCTSHACRDLRPEYSLNSALLHEITLHISIEGQMVEFDRMTTVGRNGDIRIYEDVLWVSRHHMKSIADQFGNIWIRDGNSKVGTFINGRRITSDLWLKLQSEDNITFGGILPVELTRTTVQTILKETGNRPIYQYHEHCHNALSAR